MKTRVVSKCIGLAAALMVSVPAQALLIEQTQRFDFDITAQIGEDPGAQIPMNVLETDGGTLLFDFFDASLGALNSVEISLHIFSEQDGVATYYPQATDGSQAGTRALFAFRHSYSYGVLPDGELDGGTTGAAPRDCTIGTSDLLCTATSSSSTIATRDPFLSVSPDSFIGAGQFGVDVGATSEFRVRELPLPLAYGSMRHAGFIEIGIDYDYTPGAQTEVPEPATMILLGTALAGMGVMRRRRKPVA